MAYLLAALAGSLFGAGDQYLGSLSAHPWLVDSSLLSAPWLVLPFVFGCTQGRRKRAISIGCIATASALLGYFVMTLTPMEGVHLDGSAAPIIDLLYSELPVIVGAMFAAPLYGYLGYRWRTNRDWLSAALVGGAVCLEPLATAAVGRLPQLSEVWIGEVLMGLVMCGFFLWSGLLHRSQARRAS
jgi:hypothetical protein